MDPIVAHIPWYTLQLDFKPAQQEENNAWLWKSKQLPKASEVMDLRGERTTTSVLPIVCVSVCERECVLVIVIVISTNKLGPQSSPRKFLFTTDGDYYRKPQPIELQKCEAQSQRIYLQKNSSTHGSGAWKDHKHQMIREFAAQSCLLGMSESTPMKYHKHDCLHMRWTKTTSINMLKRTRESPWGFNLHKELKATKNTGSGRETLLQGIAPIIQYQMVSSETYIWITLYRLNRLYLWIYTYIHICV